jgi:hypothetical protein
MTVARNSAITSMSAATAERSTQPAPCADVVRAGTAMSDRAPLHRSVPDVPSTRALALRAEINSSQQ